MSSWFTKTVISLQSKANHCFQFIAFAKAYYCDKLSFIIFLIGPLSISESLILLILLINEGDTLDFCHNCFVVWFWSSIFIRIKLICLWLSFCFLFLCKNSWLSLSSSDNWLLSILKSETCSCLCLLSFDRLLSDDFSNWFVNRSICWTLRFFVMLFTSYISCSSQLDFNLCIFIMTSAAFLFSANRSLKCKEMQLSKEEITTTATFSFDFAKLFAKFWFFVPSWVSIVYCFMKFWEYLNQLVNKNS